LNLRHIIEPSLVGAGNLVGNTIGGVFWLMLASILDASSYGVINYQLALASILATASLMGFNNTIMTYLAKGNEILLKQVSFLVLLVASVLSLILALLNQIPAAILLVGLVAFLFTIAELLGRKQYRNYALVVMTNRGLQFGLSISLYYAIGLQGIIIGYTLSSIILGYRIFLINKASLSLSEIKPKMSFTMHAFSLSLSQSLSLYLDKLIIAPIAGFAILGLYQFGFQFLMFLSVIPTSLFQYLLPQEASGIERKVVRKLGLVVSITLAIISYFFIPYVIEWLFPNYTEAITSAQIMVFGIIPLSLNSIMNSRLLGRGNSRPVLIGSVVYVSSLICLLFVLKDILGLIGFALSVVIALSLQSLTIWLLIKKL
jgi:O-antigen/teichoic acid export membrane protein